MLFARMSFHHQPWFGGFLDFGDPPLDLRKYDLDHPVWLHPDWPPHTELAFAIYRLQCAHHRDERLRIEQLRRKWEAR